MEDDESKSTALPPPRRGRWGIFLFLILLGLLGTGAWLAVQYERQLVAELQTGRQATQRLAREVAALQDRAATLETRQSDLDSAGQRGSAALAGLAARIDAHDQVVGALREEISGDQQRFQLGAVEQLLLLANDRVQLARDPAAAATALEAADRRLASLADPRLFQVREALARERAALASVALPDLTAATLTLASLIERAPRLPLAARVPQRFAAPPPGDAAAVAGDGWWERARASMVRALKGTFTVRRSSGPPPQLLGVEQEALVYQVLMLKLEGARAALLRADSAAFRDLVEASRRWVAEWFRKDDPGVLAAQAELERLEPLELAPPLPDISRSLLLLRAQLKPAPQ